MAKEIERKYLVNDPEFINSLTDGTQIIQAYLNPDPDSTVRIRIYGDRGFLTIKSRNDGITRNEWEYEIPVDEAKEILEGCHVSGLITKVRYRHGRWEIDKFTGRHSGLVLAEIELQYENEAITLPDFIGREVSDDSRYYNSNIAVCSELPPIR